MIRQGQSQETSQLYGQLGLGQGQLSWSRSTHNRLISGESDFSSLSKLRNVILALRREWGPISEGGIQLQNTDLGKRLQLAESEIDGLLRKQISFTSQESSGGQRVLDYSTLLNEKENQIVELEKKIQNLEESLKRASKRQGELEQHISDLTQQLRSKDQIIELKHASALAEVAISNSYREAFERVKKNLATHRAKLAEHERLFLEGVQIPSDVGSFDLRAEAFSEKTVASRSRTYQQQSEGGRLRTKLVQLFREFERASQQGALGQQAPTDADIELILQGFLSTMQGSRLYQKVQYSLETYRMSQQLLQLQDNFNIAAGVYSQLIATLRRNNANLQFPVDVDRLFDVLKANYTQAVQVASGAVFINEGRERVVEVPVQDVHTKQLIHLFASQLKSLFFKYPKLQGEIDERIAEFVREEVIELMSVDEIDRLVQIVRYVPQTVKVDNVYTHSSEKDRKVEFHLRVLIKALLEQLEKIRIKTGVVLEMDEGVIGMIRSEIMDVVSVDDILKVFRVTPKLVEVEKIVEKVVERVVEVPKVITVDKIVEKIVEVEKIKEVQKVVHVPIETPMVVETQIEKLVPCDNRIQTIVEVPTIVEKIVEMRKQVPRVEEIEVVREKVVEVDRPVEVQKVINHVQVEYQEVEIFKEKLVPVETVVEKIIQVPVFVEKIVERVVEVPQVVEVQKVVEKIVPAVEYRNAPETVNHIQTKFQEVEKIVEKIVPIVQVRERIKEVPQTVEVIKQVTNTITEIKEVEVFVEKLVNQEVIKEVPRVDTQVVEVAKEVFVEVERVIEVPVIKEVPVVTQIVVEKPVVSRVESVHIKEVVVKEPLVVKQPKVVEVQKFVNVYVDVPKSIKYVEEKVVEVPTLVDRIKQVPVVVEKVIEKMVEVPKVVEVEKVVEKVVVVPRVVEKVIEVPQVIEKVVEKEVIKETVREVEVQVQVPVIQETIKEVEVTKNIYIEVEKPVDRVVQTAVEVPVVEVREVTQQILREVPINLIHEVPRDIAVEKIVPQMIEVPSTIEVERQIIVPYEIPVPVDRIVEKVVTKPQIIEKAIPVPQVLEKLIPVVEEQVRIQQVERIIEKIVVEKQIQEVEKIVPYINEVIKEVPTIIQKIVPVESKVEQIVTAQQIIEKVVEKTVNVPQILQVERIKEKLVEVPKLVQIEKVVPQIVRVNQYVQKIAEKIVEVPTLIETLKEVVREQEKVVPQSEVRTEIVEVEKHVEKLVYIQKLKEVVRNVNYIEKVLQIVDRIEQVPVAVATSEEKFIEVPFILEKIVEKIVLMPQIVEVLKYVHEVCEVEGPGAAVDVEVGQHEARYKQLSRSVQAQLDLLVRDLRGLKNDPNHRGRIENIERFLDELRKFILVPRIVKVTEEKTVEKEVPVDKIVRMPAEDEHTLRMELSLGILVEKLVAEVRRLKQKTGAQLELDEDIRLIFLQDIGGIGEGEMQSRLKNYSALIQRQFEAQGGWSLDHQMMLNNFLQERFMMAQLLQNANLEIERARQAGVADSEGLRASRVSSGQYVRMLDEIVSIIDQQQPVDEIVRVINGYRRQRQEPGAVEFTYNLNQLQFTDERIQSYIRQRDEQITRLRESLRQVQLSGRNQPSAEQEGIIKVLRGQMDKLKIENNELLTQVAQLGLSESYQLQIQQLQNRNLELQGQISQLRSDLYNKEQELKLVQQGLSFRRQPDTRFQEIDLGQGQSGAGQSRISVPASSQGQSTTSMSRQAGDSTLQPRQVTSVIEPGQAQGRQESQSGAGRGAAAGSTLGAGLSDTGKLSQSVYTSNKPGESMIQTGLSQSHAQRRETQQPSQLQYQQNRESLVTPYGQGLSGQQGGGNYGACGQSGLGNLGAGSNYGVSQGGQSGVRGGQLEGSGVRSYYAQPGGSTSRTGDVSGGQSGVREGLTYSSAIREGSQASGSQSLYSSRQEGSRFGQPSQSVYTDPKTLSRVTPGTQTASSTARPEASRTPVETLKYESPSPAVSKLTESAIRKEEGSTLSKAEGRSPQPAPKDDNPRGSYRYYYDKK